MGLVHEAVSGRARSEENRKALSRARERNGARGFGWRPVGGALIAAAFLFSMIPGVAVAQLVVQESGFVVTTFPPGVGAKGIECSPGGVWGDYVYVADSAAGVIERIDFEGEMTLFASGLGFPVGMDFGPGPGSSFGEYLYVADFSGDSIVKIDTSGTTTTFAAMSGPADVKFDPTGVYGDDLYATTAFESPINTINPTGTLTLFTAFESVYLRFGPGGDWGTGLYATDSANSGLAKIDSAGVGTAFGGSFSNPEGFDWAFGPGFNGDMFLSDLGNGQIYRIKSDGSKSVFALLTAAADVSYCNGALYVVSFQGGCFKIAVKPVFDIPALSTPGSLFLLLVLVVTGGFVTRLTRDRHRAV